MRTIAILGGCIGFCWSHRSYCSFCHLPPKIDNSQMKKKSGSFHISAQNRDYGYWLEPPR